MISPGQDERIDFAPNNFLGSFFLVAKTVLLSPQSFFERMKTEGGLKNPLLFLVCCVLIHTLVVSLFIKSPATMARNMTFGIGMPFVTAGILFLIITRLFKASGTYEASFRVNAYAAAPHLFSWIPLVGILLEFYRLYLIAWGLSYAFSIKISRAVLAIAVTVLIYAALGGAIMSHILGGQTPMPAP